MSTVFRLLLLAGLLVCAVATALVKKPLRAVIIYMAYSIIMSVSWILLEAPDLALTEAAVGAGITGILFFLTLRRIDRIDRDADVEETQGEEEPHEENEATPLSRNCCAVAEGDLDLTQQLYVEKDEPQPEAVEPYQPKRDRDTFLRSLRRSLRLYNVLAFLLCAVFAALMLMTVANLPRYGSADAPTVNEVAQRYVEQGTEETGAVNTVAGMSPGLPCLRYAG